MLEAVVLSGDDLLAADEGHEADSRVGWVLLCRGLDEYWYPRARPATGDVGGLLEGRGHPVDDRWTRVWPSRSRDRPQVSVRLTAQLCDERVHDAALVLLAPVGDGADHGAFALEQRRDRLVDGVRRE